MSGAFSNFLGFVRQRPLLTLCIAVTVLLAIGNYFLWKQREDVALRHEVARRNGEFMLRALSSRARIDADLGALREAMAQIEANLLDEQGMERNLGYFYRFEKLTGVRLVRLNQLAAPPSPAGSPFKSVPFSMQVTGSYRKAMQFLWALETGPRILRVRHCSFERMGGDNTDLTLDLTVDVLAKS